MTAYMGFDPTADSLHVGHLLPIMAMFHLRNSGIGPIAVIGGATGLIGDPSGRNEERTRLHEDLMNQNSQHLKRNLRDIFGDSITILNNYEWYKGVELIDFMRSVASHFRINNMINKESVQSRLRNEKGMSFTEFSYQILQAYDFEYLFRTRRCRIQIGGNDQWGNISAGIDFIHKIHNVKPYGITTPLLKTAKGLKISKSIGDTIWLSSDKTSPYDLYQWFIQMDDIQVESMLKWLTFLSPMDIEQIVSEHRKAPHDRLAQKELAHQTLRIIHGENGYQSAKIVSDLLHTQKPLLPHKILAHPQAIAHLSKNRCLLQINRETVSDWSIFQLFKHVDLVDSKSEFKRHLKGGSIYLNDIRVLEMDKTVAEVYLASGDLMILSVGKKKYKLVLVK